MVMLYNDFQNVYVNINRILSVGSRLMESNHYAAPHVRSLAARLDRAWKEFSAGLAERSAVLQLSVLFHHKAEQYVENVQTWNQACENGHSIPSEIIILESFIRQHQGLYEAMCQAYTEVRIFLAELIIFHRLFGTEETYSRAVLRKAIRRYLSSLLSLSHSYIVVS